MKKFARTKLSLRAKTLDTATLESVTGGRAAPDVTDNGLVPRPKPGDQVTGGTIPVY